MPKEVLFSWIGRTDLKAAEVNDKSNVGPVALAAESGEYDYLVILSNYSRIEEKLFAKWLKTKIRGQLSLEHLRLKDPTDYRQIYESTLRVIENTKNSLGSDIRCFYHLSPGTPAMAAIWILLSKTLHPATLIQSSRESGVKKTSFPFEISAEYVQNILKPSDAQLIELTQSLAPEQPEFAAIIHRCGAMKRVIARARRLADFDVPVLIWGESGTGKELFAQAIHAGSSRKGKAFIAVNCGAIPSELAESELFGYKKGAFTGAVQDREGYFLSANSGTLFLDEIGELPLSIQVKLLRAIQEKCISRVGSFKAESVDVRIIAATNKNLSEEMLAGRFRHDLFQRIAVGVLQLPPLRERREDLDVIIDYLLGQINQQFHVHVGWQDKKISIGARKFMHEYPWPGNIRELSNSIARASIWTLSTTIEIDDIKQSVLFTLHKDKYDDLFTLPLGDGIDLNAVISRVAHHYLVKAFEQSGGNKSKMASLLGLSSYQTVNNWLKKHNGK